MYKTISILRNLFLMLTFIHLLLGKIRFQIQDWQNKYNWIKDRVQVNQRWKRTTSEAEKEMIKILLEVKVTKQKMKKPKMKKRTSLLPQSVQPSLKGQLINSLKFTIWRSRLNPNHREVSRRVNNLLHEERVPNFFWETTIEEEMVSWFIRHTQSKHFEDTFKPQFRSLFFVGDLFRTFIQVRKACFRVRYLEELDGWSKSFSFFFLTWELMV